MASTPKRRPKQVSTNPKIRTQNISSSSSSSHSLLIEPSPSLFPSKSDFLRLIAVVAIAASVAFVCNFIANVSNRQPKPFCDSDAEFSDFLPDFCKPCPSNGVCVGGKLECVHGYRRHGQSCVEDGEINEMAKKLSKLVEVHVCKAHAQYLCEGIGVVWVRGDDLWKKLDELNPTEDYGLDSAKHVLARQRAMQSVGKLLDTRENSLGIRELKCPDVLVGHYKPLACHVRQWIVKHALVAMQICVLILGCIFILLKFWRRRKLSVRAEELYAKICDVLEENAIHSRSVNGEDGPWVVASWLRDHLLLPRERREPLLWKRVQELVHEDSRITQYPKMVKGESKVVWEWQVEGSLSSLRKMKKSNEKLGQSTDARFLQHRLDVKVGQPLSS